MQAMSRSRLTTASLFVLAGLAALLLWNRPVESQLSRADSVRWEYKTVAVDANALETTLGNLGKESWEVFSLARADVVVDQGIDGKTHVLVEKYQVTARKRSRR